MKLYPQTVTPGARVMLPVYPLAYGAMGVFYIFQAASRTSSDAFDVAKAVLPIGGWGLLFIIVAVFEALGLFLHNRRLYLYALIPGAGLAAFWAVVVGMSSFFSPLVTFTAGVWIMLVAIGQGSLARSLARAEIV